MKVYSTAYKNVSSNFATISADASDLSAKYDAKDYFSVGADAANIARIALPQVAEEFLQ